MHSMRSLVVAIVVSAALVIGIDPAEAQNDLERKVVARVAAVYPEIAKRTHLVGVVKVQVMIRPDGTVKSTKVLGGHPVLIPPAIDAVRRWKFEGGPEESTEVVEVTFQPR